MVVTQFLWCFDINEFLVKVQDFYRIAVFIINRVELYFKNKSTILTLIIFQAICILFLLTLNRHFQAMILFKSVRKSSTFLVSKALAFQFGTSKKAHYASTPKHASTHEYWPKGSGIISSPQITVMLWNVNGFRSVRDKNMLSQLFHKYKQKVDFICLNETKISHDKYLSQQKLKGLDIKQAQGFHQYWNFCKVSQGYSGVMTFSKHLPLNVIEDMALFPHHSMEGRILTLEFNQFYLVNLYKPNSGNELVRLQYRMQYEDCFRQFISQLQQTKPVIIASDMNVANQPIDLKHPKRNQGKACYTIEQRQKFKQLLRQCKFSDSFRQKHPTTAKYSYWSYRNNARQNNSGWRLDYVLVDKRLKVIDADILKDIHGSDHCPVFAKVQLFE